MMDALQRLYAHLRWADQRVHESLQRADRPPARALEIYAHIVAAEHVWLSRVLGRPPRTAVWPALGLDECAALAAETHTAFESLLTRLDETAVRRNVHYRNSAGDEFDSSLADILLHVALHGTYHRGQVALLLRDAGVEPEPTDYIALVRGAPAATRPG